MKQYFFNQIKKSSIRSSKTWNSYKIFYVWLYKTSFSITFYLIVKLFMLNNRTSNETKNM